MKSLRKMFLALGAIGLAAMAYAVGPTWHHDGTYLTTASGWKIAVDTATAGALAIANDAIKACPATADYAESDGTATYALDLSGDIDDGSYVTQLGAYSFRICNAPKVYLRKIVLPDTVTTIPSGAATLFGSQSYLTDISPAFPVALTTYSNLAFNNGPKNFTGDLFFLNDAFAVVPQQGINGWRGTNVYFGVGLTTLGNYLFQGRANPTRFYFFGDPPTTYGDNFTSQAGVTANGMLLCYPKGNVAWEAYLAENARTPTDAEITATQNIYPDVTATAIFTSGVWASIGNKARAVAWEPWGDAEWFQIRGDSLSVSSGMGLVKPEYGLRMRSTMGDTVVCSAPAAKQTYLGSDYVLKGYVVEKYAGNGTWTEVAKGEGNSYTFANSTIGSGSYRLSWQWQIDARYQLDYHASVIPEGGVTVTVDPAPDEEGLYEVGTVVTLTATDGANADWGAFGAWTGDVGNERRWTDSRSISITMDGHKSIYCGQAWSFTGSALYDGVHTIKASASDKNVSILIDAAKGVTPIYPALDLRKKIAGGYTLTAINDYGTRSAQFSELYLPETLASLGAHQDMNSFTYVYPFIPSSVATLGARGLQNVAYAGEVRFMNENLTEFPEQVIYGTSIKNIVLGKGFTLIGQHFFQHLGGDYADTARTVKFLGGCPTVRAWNNTCGNGALRMFVDPVNNESWSTYIASSAREATDEDKTAYVKKFGDDGTTPSYVTTNAMPIYAGESSGVWGNGQYLVLWNPNTDDTGLFVSGSPKNYPAEVKPYYGGNYDYAIGETVVCTAPATTTDEDGSEVTCTGYVLEKANADGTWTQTASGSGNSVSFTQTKGYHRLVWQWQKGAVQVKIGAVPYPETDSVTVTPAKASYYPGDTITVTANGDAFSRWYGDVPAGHEYDKSFTMTLEDAVSLTPYFAHPWTAVAGYETTRMTDGYWTLKIAQTAEGEVSIPIDCMKASQIQQPTTNLVTVLDLRKPISGGRTLVAIDAYAFRYSTDNTTAVQFRQLLLADTIRSIGMMAFSGHPLEDIDPCLPASLTTLGMKVFAETCTYDGTLALTNKAFTTFPQQLFNMGGCVSKIILGTGVTNICQYAFDTQKGDFDIYFNGNVPVFENTGWFRSVSDQRLFVPKARWNLHADWTDFVATSCTAITAAQLASYAAKYGEDAPKPVAKFSGQYVVYFECPYDRMPGFFLFVR